MDSGQIFEQVIAILKPFAKAPELLDSAGLETSLLGDLKINSARLVDVVLEIEDRFGFAVEDAEADKVRTIGDAVELIRTHAAA